MTCRQIILVIVFLMTVSGAAMPVRAESDAPAEHLPDLVTAAIANNPEVKASEARWQMFKSRIAQVRSFDDPMLMLKLQNGIIRDPVDFRKDSMTQKVIGISQQIPFWGKRELRGEIAAREAESYRWSVEERKLELARMVKETYYQLYSVDKSLQIVSKNIRILDDFIALAETRYSVGQGAQQDIFKAQVERSRMLDMQITLAQQRTSLEANLNALLFRPTGTPVGKIPEFEIRSLDLSQDDLRKEALENRPQFKSLNAQIEKGRAGHRLAEKEFYPDFNVSFEYMQRDPAMGGDGLDMYTLGVTFNLPVQRERRHAMAAESDSEERMAAEETNTLKNTVNAGIADLIAQLERRRKLVELYKSGIIPQAEQSLESATIGYQVGKVDFLTLLDNRVTLFNYEREYFDSLADYQIKKAQLEALVGKELP